ncbi:MBL fold metallo-hydrolase [Halanaeroarchaeum sulfurireducens]|uniref:Metallo-beta-lactamase family hydrolase n=1 Tax=Halanaeroarchaeum sulfurireducens TaxID=1604004 RepID=A0A0F7PCP3_9EURY|nr:MBL fold metallo-hydrolase [Halanaeroarchaeum sulfurireducens]AKH98462.1 metallo-beta-lactamase family hydrolase [Halanaeroarchaeum sulfurireducens]ALG82856.1 metallo-beta-lactamase family hydrolase [Halanaeroarchaeum sulfurireducens]
MAPGDVFAVESASDVYYVDTGMYDTPEYGAVYIVDAERPAVVDTGIGTDRELVMDAIESVGIDLADLEVIAPTHVHLDHAGGTGFLAEAAPDATVYVHEMGARHLVDPSRLVEGTKAAVGDQWEFYTEPEPVPEDRITELTDGDVIDLGDRQLDVHHAPGHAPHQVVFHDAEDEAVYVADAAGVWVPELGEIHPLSPPPNFDLDKVLDSAEMIADLDPSVLLYPHFGPVDEDVQPVLAEYERVIVEWVDTIEEHLDDLGDEDAVVEHFVETNEMTAIWGERKARGETAMNVRGVLRYLQADDA